MSEYFWSFSDPLTHYASINTVLNVSKNGHNLTPPSHTAILYIYRASTGPEQGFPCVVFPHREKFVFVTGFPGNENRFFLVRKTTQGKPCFHYRDGFAVQSF
jgi:hypothetical protein